MSEPCRLGLPRTATANIALMENYAGHPESTWGSDGLEHQGPVQWTAATDPNVPDVDVPEHPSYMFKAYYSPDPCSASFRIANMWWDIDITGIVEAWRTESIPNWGLYGFGNGYYSHVRFSQFRIDGCASSSRTDRQLQARGMWAQDRAVSRS